MGDFDSAVMGALSTMGALIMTMHEGLDEIEEDCDLTELQRQCIADAKYGLSATFAAMKRFAGTTGEAA